MSPGHLLGSVVERRIVLTQFEDTFITNSLASSAGAVSAEAPVMDTQEAGGHLSGVGESQGGGGGEGGGAPETDGALKHSRGSS